MLFSKYNTFMSSVQLLVVFEVKQSTMGSHQDWSILYALGSYIWKSTLERCWSVILTIFWWTVGERLWQSFVKSKLCYNLMDQVFEFNVFDGVKNKVVASPLQFSVLLAYALILHRAQSMKLQIPVCACRLRPYDQTRTDRCGTGACNI